MEVAGAEKIIPLRSVRRLGNLLSYPPEKLRDVAREAAQHYRPYTETRKGKPRQIDRPVEPLKGIQSRIYERLLSLIVFPKTMHGGIRGRSVASHAARHVRKREVVQMDIENFFPSISSDMVAQALREAFRCGHDACGLLVALTTYEGRLPQGAPTSMALANLVIAPMIERIDVAAQKSGHWFGTYVDDLALSGDRPRDLIGFVKRELALGNLRLAKRKTAVMGSGGRQVVAGTVVNRKTSVGRHRLKLLRSRLQGMAPNDQVEAQRVAGSIAHVGSVSRSQAAALRRRREKMNARNSNADAAKPETPG
jgi:RNA-directed DNA polymerase